MVEFHPNFSALHPHTSTACRPGLIEALRQSICLGMIRRCETMINVTQVDERGNKSGSKTAPRSVIITRGAPCLRTISSNYYPFVSMSRLWKSPKGDQFQCDGKEAIAGGMGTKRVRWSLRNGLSPGTPDNA
ncbi:hypothetical protein TNCV_2962961 [Trichonephila clavipes]|nr:hypothetical protein TNCV_2962961 [Trichonephila clavipes]